MEAYDGIIGQKNLKEQIARMAMTGWPRFVIITGPSRGGKRMVAGLIAQMLNVPLINSGTKAENVRETIAQAHKQSEPYLYLFADADDMSIAAKNALLKITEEPTRQAHFIMTAVEPSNIMSTLLSRAAVLSLDPYTSEEILKYADRQKYELTKEESTIVASICRAPGDVDLLIRYDVMEFYKYVVKVVDSVGKVTGVNAFKISNKLSFKADDLGWDTALFLQAVMFVILQKMNEDVHSGDKTALRDVGKLCRSMIVTNKYLTELTIINGVNKAWTIDMWILAMRDIWRELPQ